jgi:hypothetical protein
MRIQKRDLDHLQLWRRDVAAWKTERLSLEQQIARLKRELEERPIQVVRENLDAEVVADAEEARDRAYRSRDLAYHDLCHVRLLHRDSGDGSCRCGLPTAKCRTAKLIGETEHIKAWERRQIGLL